MAERIYTSSVDRLASLPEIFTGGDLTVLFGWKSAIASSYLANWRKAGLVKSLGGRSDVHMNLVVNRQFNRDAALRRAFPNALKLGVEILRAAGWTTQIPTVIDVAVPPSRSLYLLEGFELTQRPEKWFQTVEPGIQRVSVGINQLRPAWALADMLARAQDRRVRNAWLLDPEDLDFDSVRADKDLLRALQAFELPPDCLNGADYEALYDRFAKATR